MLEHQKIVLKGVCDNTPLFRKELLKSMQWIDKSELQEFNLWVWENFRDIQPDVVEQFIEVPADVV